MGIKHKESLHFLQRQLHVKLMDNFISTRDFDETQAASTLLEQLSADSHRSSPSPPADDVTADGFSRSESTSTPHNEESAGGSSREPSRRYVLKSASASSSGGTAADLQIVDLHREPQLRTFYVDKGIDEASYKLLDDMHFQMASLVEERGGRRASLAVEAKIPRPPNAFMIYANEFRRILASEFPRESNKEISVRLGTLWKHMEKGMKDKYFHLSRVVDAEHKKRYPNYVYNPKEARMRKAIRDQTREANRLYSGKISSPTKRAHNGQLLQPNESPQSRRMLESSSKGKNAPGGPGGIYNPPHWPGEGVSQYCGAGTEGYLDIPYQAHDGGIYSNIVNGHGQSQWYPFPMQQDGSMQYAQAWPSHGGPAGYAAQRMQYAQMQPSVHESGPQPGQQQSGFQNYEQPSEANQNLKQQQQQQQQLQAGNAPKVPKRGENAEPVLQTGSAAAGSSSFQGQPNMNVASTSNGSARRQGNAAKPDASATTSQQESGSTTPQMSPTRAYNKYLQGNEMSPPSNWPFLRMSPSDDHRAHPALTGSEKNLFNYFNESMPQFTYYDYGMMPAGDYGGPAQHDGRTHYVNHAQAFSSQPSKAEEFARGLRQFRPPTMKPTEDCFRQRDRLNLVRVAKPADEVRRSADAFSTVTLSVMSEDVSKKSGGRVIATYESQGDAPDGRPGRGMPDISSLGVGDDVGNKTFSFMQDQSLKNMMRPIDAVDNPKIIHQGKNVCVMTNDPFEELNDLAGGNSDNSLDSM